MANEVRIKLTDEQRAKIKKSTGQEMGEIRVASLGANAAITAHGTVASPRVASTRVMNARVASTRVASAKVVNAKVANTRVANLRSTNNS